MVHYFIIDHTADLGIQVFGIDPKQLFTHAGLSMFDLITDIQKLTVEDEHLVSVKGEDWPDLMVVWLRELLYMWVGKEMLVKSIDIQSIGEFKVSARVAWARFDPDCHVINREIKAVTYHQIQVTRTSRGWTSTIIFDI